MTKIEDFGEKLGGAAKDRFAGVSLSDISAADLEAYCGSRDEMHKETILGKADYRELVAAGRPADLCLVYKRVRDALPAQPRLRQVKPRYRQRIAELYVECLKTIRHVFESSQTANDMLRLEKELIPEKFVVVKGTQYLSERADFVASALGGNRGFLAIQLSQAHLEQAAAHIAATAWPASTQSAIGESAPKIVRPTPEVYCRTVSEIWRPEGHVTREVFDRTFAFRAGEFGNWASENERHDFCDHFFDALKDLGRVLRLPDIAMSLNGRLAVAFGSRGRAGAVAHYEPGLRVLHFTKHRWSGSVAHEWAHAVDHLLLDVVTGGVRKGKGMIYNGSLIEIVASPGSGILSSKDYAELRNAYASFGELLRLKPAGGLGSFGSNAEICDQRRQKLYYSTHSEMFARAFEFAVAAKLGAKRSDWLVYGVNNSFYESLGMRPFPDNSQAGVFADWLDSFMAAAKPLIVPKGRRSGETDVLPGLG